VSTPFWTRDISHNGKHVRSRQGNPAVSLGFPHFSAAAQRCARRAHLHTFGKVDWVQILEGAAAFHLFREPEELWPSESIERIQALSDG
jgi:hypothetical protein